MTASRAGTRALWISFAALSVTAAGQAALVAATGSVALLGDTLHNIADALTAVPLGIAFLLGRRAATRRFPYGLGRTEDLAGLFIVGLIAVSAGLACWQAAQRLTDPHPASHPGWIAAAGVLGFAGNEFVARYRIRVGREIGSAALVADGRHARTDGFTSLAVVLSAGAGVLGWWWADPVIGLAISAVIVVVLWGTAKEIFSRLLDAVDPALITRAEYALADTPGVRGVGLVRMRWVGHRLHAETDVEVDGNLSLAESHRIAHDAEHRLLHALPRMSHAVIHAHPAGPRAEHDLVAHHHHGQPETMMSRP